MFPCSNPDGFDARHANAGWKQLSFMITQQRENWNPWIGTGISFLWWRDFFFFFIVTTNQSTASFQNDTILQKLCKLRWFRLSSWFSTFIRSQPRVDIKHWAQTVKMSLHNVKLRLLVTVGDRDSLASGRLSHPDGKVICSHFFKIFIWSFRNSSDPSWSPGSKWVTGEDQECS